LRGAGDETALTVLGSLVQDLQAAEADVDRQLREKAAKAEE
jgi:hypothetical protein